MSLKTNLKKRKKIDIAAPLAPEQIKMLEALKIRSVKPTDNCPELTKEQLQQLTRVQ